MGKNRAVKLAYLVSHPIQYQSPLLRLIAQQPEIDLKVFYLSDLSTKTFEDKGFGEKIRWDIPLLKGYEYEFIPAVGKRDMLSFWRPYSYGLAQRLRAGSFDALWVHGYSHYSHVLAVSRARKMGMKVLMRGESNLTSARRGLLKKAVKKRFLRWLFAQCHGFLCIGSLNREYYRHYGAPEAMLFDMPYAVDNEFFQRRVAEASPRREDFRASLGLKPGRPVILYAGKLISRKHPMDLLDAYTGLSQDGMAEPVPYLLFVGNGEERGRLEARARATGWSSIRFTGFQNQTRVPAFYDLCDVFVLPSTYEPWGLVINEAMNAAKPVIVSDQVGCARDLVRDGENGFIVPPGNIAALTRALAKSVQDPARTRQMGEKSLQRINRWGFQEDLKGLMLALNTVMKQ